MSSFTMETSGGGFSRGSSLPNNTGTYHHGQIFELIADNLSSPSLFYWNDLLKAWKPFDSSGSATYSNSNPMPASLGGYSIGTSFSGTHTVQEVLDGLLYPYIEPSIGFLSTSSLIQELGTSLSSVQLNASITKKSDNITKIEYYKNGSLIYTNSSPITSGGTDSYTDSTGINSNTTYSIKVYDSKPNSVSNSLSFNYIYPMYIGNVDNLNPIEIDVKGMAKKLVSKSNQSLSYTLSNSRFCFAFPSSYGSLTSIKDPNNFEMISSFTKSTSNFTMLDGKSVPYSMYTLTMPTTQSSFTITYLF